MEFSIKLHTINSKCSIVSITKGSQMIIPKNIEFLSPKIDFILASCAEPDEMVHSAAFHHDLQCLQKYQFRGIQSTKGQTTGPLFHILFSVSDPCQK